MASLTGKGELHHVSLWIGAEKQCFSGPRYNTSVIKHTIYVSEVTIPERREKCFGKVCNEHGMYIAPQFEDNWSKYEKKSPWPTGQICTGNHSFSLPSRGKAMLICVPLKFWNYPVSVLQVGGWPNYSDQGADTLESNQTVLYWVILVASESTVCVASLSIAVHWGNNN